MRPKPVLMAIAVAAVAAFGTLIAACGGGNGDELTLEEYFERFEAIDADVDQQIAALFEDFPDDVPEEEFFSNDENLPLVKELFAGFPRALEDALDRLRQLNPPSEAEDAHNEMLDAGTDLLAAFESAASEIEDVETIAEVVPLNESAEVEIAPAEQRFDASCLALVDVATANGIVTAVSCEDDG